MTDESVAHPEARESTGPPLLQVRGISKRFPGVQALDDVDLALHRGEVLAVIGENGAGKSTLMKILAGVQRPDQGTIELEGDEVAFGRVSDAMDKGIALIHQELNLADNLDVASNVFLGREPRRFGFIQHDALRRAAAKVIDQVGLRVSLSTLVENLPIGHQQMVEIAKALAFDARILIMDEPTSSLTNHEVEQLFSLVEHLTKQGVSIIYISHRLGEVKRVADRVVVLRDGKCAGSLARDEISHDRMVRLMVGRDVSQFYHHESHDPGETALSICDLRTPAHPTHAVSLEVRAGEIVGLAGLVGAGRTELLESIFGIAPPLAGEINVAGERIKSRSTKEAIDAGLALVPEDRRLAGLILDMSVRQNLSLASLARDQKFGFLNRNAETTACDSMMAQLRIKTPTHHQIVRLLSGGNQQKTVLGKWLTLKPRVLMLDEPTRGIDVGAKDEIYRILESLASEGVAVLFASSEMDEVLGLADRVIVMHEGQISGVLARDQLSEEAIMQFATSTSSDRVASEVPA